MEKQQIHAIPDLGVVMGYRFPGNEAKAIIEVYSVSGKKLTSAATETGLAASAVPTLLIEGDNKPGLAHKIAQTIGGRWGRSELFRRASRWQKVFAGHRFRKRR